MAKILLSQISISADSDLSSSHKACRPIAKQHICTWSMNSSCCNDMDSPCGTTSSPLKKVDLKPSLRLRGRSVFQVILMTPCSLARCETWLQSGDKFHVAML